MKKFGLIGTGLWGSVHAEIYSEHPFTELSAVCDIDKEKAGKVARQYGVSGVFDSVTDMLQNAEIDAVAIVTPDFAHADPIIASAEAGKHIIVEKPLATTHEDLSAIERAVKKAGITLMVDYHNRWNPPVAVTKQDIQNGKLGEILSAYYRLNDKILVPLEMLSWASKSSILWFLGSHTVDTLRYLFDDEVKRVYSVSKGGVLRKKGLDVEDLYQTILEFEKGAVATIENNWIIPNTNPFINDIKANVLGTKGMVNIDCSHNQLIERFLEDQSDHPDCIIKPRLQDGLKGFAIDSIHHFINCLLQEKTPLVGLEDGVKVSKVVLAIMESAKKRMPVEVSY